MLFSGMTLVIIIIIIMFANQEIILVKQVTGRRFLNPVNRNIFTQVEILCLPESDTLNDQTSVDYAIFSFPEISSQNVSGECAYLVQPLPKEADLVMKIDKIYIQNAQRICLKIYKLI